MKEKHDYLRDIADIRAMMENSTKFPSLSGWAGILAGIYALAAAGIAYTLLDFSTTEWTIPVTGFGLFHIIYGIYIHYKYEQ